jgi:hypothetical protein
MIFKHTQVPISVKVYHLIYPIAIKIKSKRLYMILPNILCLTPWLHPHWKRHHCISFTDIIYLQIYTTTVIATSVRKREITGKRIHSMPKIIIMSRSKWVIRPTTHIVVGDRRVHMLNTVCCSQINASMHRISIYGITLYIRIYHILVYMPYKNPRWVLVSWSNPRCYVWHKEVPLSTSHIGSHQV